jgi:predicted PurR-regulated permease PerM
MIDHDPHPLPRPEPLVDEPSRSTVPVAVDVRSVALGVLAVLGVVFTLKWASAVFIPLMIGVMFSYALDPLVDRLQRRRVPRALSAAVLLMAILAGATALVYSLADDANALVESLPRAAQKLRESMRSTPATAGPIEKVQEAAKEIEQAATEGAVQARPPRGVTRVQVERPPFDIRTYLWTGTIGLIALLGQVGIVFFLTFFILTSGDAFRRKMVQIVGPDFAQKRLTVQAMDEITGQIQRYLLVQLFTSTVVGLSTWLAFQWIGVQYAGVWGLLAGALNFVPYIGAIVVTGGAALVGFLQFGSLEMALVIGGTSFLIQTLEGYGLTPWLTSKASRMSPVAIFVGVLAWGWLWGGWGLILGVPILMVVKTACDRIEGLKPIGQLLGE